MKKIIPFLLIIALSYLVAAFVVNDINHANWTMAARILVVFMAAIVTWFYVGIKNFRF